MNALEGIMTILVLAAAIGCIALYKKIHRQPESSAFG
jgi:hypothetical protein